MRDLSHIFNTITEPQDGPVTSMYLSWDWSKPSASNRERLNDEIKATRRLLKQEMSDAEIQEYLAPFWNVMAKVREPLPDLSGIALFRTKKDFWYVQLTQDPGTFSVVAESFHVKPLIASLQDPKRFAILWFHEAGATLAYGSERQMVCSDTVLASEKDQRSIEYLREVKRMLNERIVDAQVQLILAGDAMAIRKAKHAKLHVNLADFAIQGFVSRSAMNQLEERVRSVIKEERRGTESRMMGSLFQELKSQQHPIVTDIERIARLAVSGQIRTLVVARDQKLFGQLNRKTGGIVVHGVQNNCQDDDLYDDLAECVQKHGGQVLVVAEKLIPGGAGILAIPIQQQNSAVQVASA